MNKHLHKEIDVSEVIGNCVLHITITGKELFRVRLKIAKWFFKVGAWIVGTKCKIDVE